jgi:hypothetical protein
MYGVSSSRPNPPPLGEGEAGILPPAGGGWEGGICANHTKHYTLHPTPYTL